jgi:hypothetical protein
VFKNSILLIQGKSGVHKSRLASSLASLLVSKDNEKSLLGFRNGSATKNIVIYCDTERNIKNQLPKVIQQIALDADLDYDSLKENFLILPLMNIKRNLRSSVMGLQFQEIKKMVNEKAHFVVVLDIVSDLTSDFNNVTDTLVLVDDINLAINTFDVTFIIVIHENPGSADKARGHLGTEFTNKASTTFQISESDVKEVYKLKMLKSRVTKIYDELLLKFDPVVKNLVVVTDSETQLKAGEPELYKLCQVLANNRFATMERQELMGIVIKELGWGQRKIETMLKSLITNRTVIETGMGEAVLQKTRGKNTEYKMMYLELDQPVDETNKEEIDGEI